MGKVFIPRSGGGGGVQSFLIVGGTTRPTNAAMNTIWVNTAQEITDYVLSATAPNAPAKGALWIPLVNSGSCKVGVPVENGYIAMYLGIARQYIGGAWVTKAAYFYNGIEWAELFGDGVLYDNGIFNPDIPHNVQKAPSNAKVVYGENSIIITTGTGSASAVYVVFGAVDLSKYSKVVAVVENTGSNSIVGAIIADDTSSVSVSTANAKAQHTIDSKTENHEFVLDISGVTLNNGYIAVGFNTNGQTVSARSGLKIKSVRLEE